ncbi:MAG: efflux transporter periplasmic adaptor subunit [Verrucomicrobia bacterium]|nr:MAG: efflux transporter periplasmic adaptor subunit [Verrucomicrobiota bacterium]
MTKKFLLAGFCLLVIVGVLGGIKVMQIKALIASGKSFSPPPESVTTAVAEAALWQPRLKAVGSVAAVQGVLASAELAGTVTEIAFRSGTEVETGDILIRLDTSIEEAQLAAVEAELELAELSLKRARELRQTRSNSQADLDAALAKQKGAEAQVRNTLAAIEKKTVRAPFSGRLGIRQVDLGQFLGSGEPIVSVQSFEPIYVDFWMPQQNLAKLSVGQTVQVTADTAPDILQEGQLTTISPEVDATTRNVRCRATFSNSEAILRPGMFVEATIILPEEEEVLSIPATSVIFAPYGNSVFVIREKEDSESGEIASIANQQFVRLGERRGDFVSVISGLDPGDTVVTSGAFKLRNGVKVVIFNDLAPEADLAPTPADS